MDFAYDHITEETISPDRAPTPTPPKPGAPSTTSDSSPRPNLNTEFQETLQAFSNSPWGARLGGLWGNVRKQGEQYYEEARREVEEAGEEARKGFSDLKETIAKQTNSLSVDEERKAESQREAEASESTPTNVDHEKAFSPSTKTRTESEVIRESEGIVSRLRMGAAKRLKDIEKAEEAADEALLRFGTNVRNFLRDAVAIAPPGGEGDGNSNTRSGVLFESKDSTGKRVIHTTRFDAQLHAIHSTFDSFAKDPVSAEWPTFKGEFDTNEKTNEISRDLEKYPELRRAMEQLVPEKVEYGDFWCRYYFLRLVIETEEQKRRELLKGASNQEADEEITWDADSDSDSEPNDNDDDPHLRKKKNNNASNESVPSRPSTAIANKVTLTSNQDTSSTTTLTSQHQQQLPVVSISTSTDPARDQHSHPDDSDASYDLVSGATSRTTGSPKEDGLGSKKKIIGGGGEKVVEESDEEDWE